MFFFKAVNNIITVSNEVLPQPIIPSRLTRTSVDTNVMLSFRPRKCKTLTYQRSFFIRVIRTYNSLPEDLSLVRFRTLLLDYYHNAANVDVDECRQRQNVENSLLEMQHITQTRATINVLLLVHVHYQLSVPIYILVFCFLPPRAHSNWF
jgi:hypothetical protein